MPEYDESVDLDSATGPATRSLRGVSSGLAPCYPAIVFNLPDARLTLARGLGRLSRVAYLSGPFTGGGALSTLLGRGRLRRIPTLPSLVTSRRKPRHLPVGIVTISSGPTGLGLVSTLLRRRMRAIIAYGGNVSTMRRTARRGFSVVLVSVRVPGVSNMVTYGRVHGAILGTRAPMITMATRTVTNRQRQLVGRNVSSCLAGPVRRRILRRIVVR